MLAILVTSYRSLSNLHYFTCTVFHMIQFPHLVFYDSKLRMHYSVSFLVQLHYSFGLIENKQARCGIITWPQVILNCLILFLCYWYHNASLIFRSLMKEEMLCCYQKRCMALQILWTHFETHNITVLFDTLFTVSSLLSNNYNFGHLFNCKVLKLPYHGVLFSNITNAAFIYKVLKVT